MHKIKGRGNQIKQVAEPISNNADNGWIISEVKQERKRKDETSHFIINSEGRKTENKEKILKEYQIIKLYYKQDHPKTTRQNKTRDKHKTSKNHG